jgi:hypothetical protein
MLVIIPLRMRGNIVGSLGKSRLNGLAPRSSTSLIKAATCGTRLHGKWKDNKLRQSGRQSRLQNRAVIVTNVVKEMAEKQNLVITLR